MLYITNSLTMFSFIFQWRWLIFCLWVIRPVQCIFVDRFLTSLTVEELYLLNQENQHVMFNIFSRPAERNLKPETWSPVLLSLYVSWSSNLWCRMSEEPNRYGFETLISEFVPPFCGFWIAVYWSKMCRETVKFYNLKCILARNSYH